MSKYEGVKLFVYGVHCSCPRRIIEDEFKRNGKVLDVYITGKGYAFVTMANEEEARDAIKDIDGTQIDGQEVRVEMSHGKQGRGSGSGR